MTRHAVTLVLVLLSAGCKKAALGIASQGGIASTGSAYDAVAPSLQRVGGRGALAGGGGAGAGKQAAATGPSQPVDPISYLAYAYGLTLELPADRVVGVMDAHAAACRDAGLRVCQLVGSRRDGDPHERISGSLSLRAEPQWLQRFVKSAQTDTVAAAGRVTSQWTTTDDLTREIVDTEATLRARRTLRDRLQQLLASRPGNLSDLLGVERELARVQGEIDSTESTLAAMRTRVAMSALTLQYTSSGGGLASNTFAPLLISLGEFIGAVVESTATLITFVGALLPWVIAAVLTVWALAQVRRRRRARQLQRAARSAPA